MIDIVKNIIRSILISLYRPFGFALLFSMVIMIVWNDYTSVKEVVFKWFGVFKQSKDFRKMFFLVFYTVMILFQTLLNRDLWTNPLSNVIGTWGLYRFDSSKNTMVFTTEVPESLTLFIPFTILLLWTYRDKILSKVTFFHILWRSTKIVFIFSFSIEMLQLFLRLGTWQLSDLFFNTLGGFIGGLLYWVGYKVKHRESSL